MIYKVFGYTSSEPDFELSVELPDSFAALATNPDWRVHCEAYLAVAGRLSDAGMPKMYADAYRYDDCELREDLASQPDEIVFVCHAMGCGNCCDNDDRGLIEGCSDNLPHGTYTLVLRPESEASDD